MANILKPESSIITCHKIVKQQTKDYKQPAKPILPYINTIAEKESKNKKTSMLLTVLYIKQPFLLKTYAV